MNIKLFAGAALSALMIAGSAAAATFSFGGNVDNSGTIPANFDLDLTPELAIGDPVNTITKAGGNGGLRINKDNVQIQATFLGSEAANFNIARERADGSTTTLFTNADAVGTGTSFINTIGGASGWVKILFRDVTDSEKLLNGNTTCGNCSDQLTIGFSNIFNGGKSVIVLFGDGVGDSDLDDFAMRLTIIPLPAGGLLLLTALGGMGLARRGRKKS